MAFAVGGRFNVSRPNKVNKDHYTIAGRLTPDEIAREGFLEPFDPRIA